MQAASMLSLDMTSPLESLIRVMAAALPPIDCQPESIYLSNHDICKRWNGSCIECRSVTSIAE